MAPNWTLISSVGILSAAYCVGNAFNNTDGGLVQVLSYLLRSRLSILALAYCSASLLYVAGKIVQWIFFGPLKEIEAKNMYDRLLQYVIFKFVFFGAIMEPNRDFAIYVFCFSVLCFLKIFSLLTRDRFEYITTFNPNANMTVHFKLIFLLIAIIALDITCLYLCSLAFRLAGAGKALLILFECFTLFLDTIQTLIKYTIHLIDLRTEGVWEQRGTYIYYTEFCTDTLILAATIGHYVQILFWNGDLSPTLIDLILFLHLRTVFNNLREKISSYRNYRKLAQNLKNRYPDVRGDELGDDVCAICHDRMEVAKKLPCNHIFHHSCLLSWLEHHDNCPTCRYSLLDGRSAAEAHPSPPPHADNHRPQHHHQNAPQHQQNREEIFHFNGARLWSWLPSIQVVSERRHLGGHAMHPAAAATVPQELVQQLLEIFPHVPANVIREDLLRTRSVEQTTENIVEGRVVIPQSPTPVDHVAPPASVAPPAAPPTTNSNSPIQTQPAHVYQPPITTSQNSNVQSSVQTPVSSEPIKTNFADTFANSSQERQDRLLKRKQEMMEAAKRQFLQKQNEKAQQQAQIQTPQQQQQQQSQSQESPEMRSESKREETETQQPADQEEETLEQRRRRFLEAAQKRQQTKKDV